MNAFETKVANAARLFLDRKGYSVIDIAWADPGGAGGFDIVAEDEGAIVFIDVLAEEGTESFPQEAIDRAQHEVLAAHWLATADDELIDKPVRFDTIAFLVVGESRALLRHHINALSEA